MEKKMDELTKAKLIYSGELVFIALVALVIGILELTYIIKICNGFRIGFTWVTILLSPAMLIDTIYVMVKPERRANISIFDRCCLIPIYIYLIIIDEISLINYNTMPQSYYQTVIGILIIYVAVIYLIQACYHWYHPHPTLVAAIEQDIKDEAKKKEELEKEFEIKPSIDEEMEEDNKEDKQEE